VVARTNKYFDLEYSWISVSLINGLVAEIVGGEASRGFANSNPLEPPFYNGRGSE
jgi:hypothetical protein